MSFLCGSSNKNLIKERENIIIFGDSITAFGVIRGLRNIKNLDIYLVSNDNQGIGSYSRYVKETLWLDPLDLKYISKFINWLDDRFQSKPLILIAGNDLALINLSKAHDQISKYATLSFPSWEVVKKIINKEITYSLAKDLNIPSIDTKSITSRSELKNFLDSNKNIDFPVFLKSSESSNMMKSFGSKGEICYSIDEILIAYEKFNGFNGSLLIQDFIPGDIDKIFAVLLVLDQKGNAIAAASNKKIRSGTIYGSTSLSKSFWNENLIKRAIILAKSLGYYGPIGVQFKFDPRDNEYKFLEINGRFSVSVSLSQKCGVNLPKIVFDEFMNRKNNKDFSFQKATQDNVILWYPLSDIKILGQKRFYRNPVSYLGDLLGRSYIIEPFSFRDPLPVIMMFFKMIRAMFRKLFKIYA